MQVPAGSGSRGYAVPQEPQTRTGGQPRLGLLLGSAGVVVGGLVAVIVARGHGPLAGIVLLAVPVVLLGIRHPIAIFWTWLLIAPLLDEVTGGLARRAFWVLHRGLPVFALVAIVLDRQLNPGRTRRLRFGLIEWTMLGYVVVSWISIMYLSEDPRSIIVLYDRVIVPMLLFYLVRSRDFSSRQLSRLVPAAAYIAISQSVIGVLAWVAPELLPTPWLGREGQRTVGSLQLPGTYSTAILFGCIILAHYALSGSAPKRRSVLALVVAAFGFFMVFMTFSRASWLAGLVAVIGLLWLYPRKMTRLALVGVPILAIAIGVGLLSQQAEFAQDRLVARQSAAARLPMMYASIQMWQTKPLMGYGYGNFEIYDRDFQRAVAGFVPEEDRASHNVYLTILAEQGTVGILLYLAPAGLVFLATCQAWPHMARDGFTGRRLVGALWLVLGAHVVVNNFANMKSTFGLGMWWIMLGLITTIVSRPRAPIHR